MMFCKAVVYRDKNVVLPETIYQTYQDASIGICLGLVKTSAFRELEDFSQKYILKLILSLCESVKTDIESAEEMWDTIVGELQHHEFQIEISYCPEGIIKIDSAIAEITDIINNYKKQQKNKIIFEAKQT